MSKKALYFEYNQEGNRPLRLPMTEEKFLKVKDHPDRWFISFGTCVLEVDKAEYESYYKEREHSRYCGCDASGKVVQNAELDALNVDYVKAVNPFTRLSEISVEEIVMEHLVRTFEVKRLHEAMGELSPDELALIVNLYYRNKSQKELAKELGITQQGVSKRLSVIL